MSTTAKKTAAKKSGAASRPAGAAKPQDRKPKSTPAKAEANGDGITFTHEGKDYVIARDAADDLEVMELFEKDKPISAIEKILGKEQWTTFKETAKKNHGRVTEAVFGAFMDSVLEATGGN